MNSVGALSIHPACRATFDVQGHRGARGLRPENTLAAFELAIDLGVTTLELDTGISADGIVVVCHDLVINPQLCLTADGQRLPEQPQLRLKDLTVQEIQQFDCGCLNPDPIRFPEQQAVPGAHIPTLQQVIDLAESKNSRIRYNIESKVTPLHPGNTASPEVFAEKLVEIVIQNQLVDRAMIQSFDWRVLREVKQRHPGICTSALVLHSSISSTLQAAMGASPFLAGLSFNDHSGNVCALLQAAGYIDVVSPNFEALLPDSSTFLQPITDFHQAGFAVIPWTVNEEPMMHQLIELGVDGLITDFPDRLLKLLAGDYPAGGTASHHSAQQSGIFPLEAAK